MQLTNAASAVPMSTTDVGSSLLETARKPTIRNNIPAPHLPGSKLGEYGTMSESTKTNAATARRNILCHVHWIFADFGSRNFSQLCGIFT
jgi:hypothetical protein